MNWLAVSLLAWGASPSVDFDTQIVPILTKAGCNAAACHGAAAGRGGFKLSLFGGDPGHDLDEIVNRLEGRRVNLAVPAESLLVTKPTEQLAHGGGTRIEFEGREAQLIENWIGQGARRLQARQLLEIDVEPHAVAAALHQQIKLRVTATFDDGTRQDMSRLAVYTAADPAAVAVDSEGRLEVLRRGRHVVVVRLLNQVETVQLTVPLADAVVDLGAAMRKNWIDDEILGTLAELRLVPGEQADDFMLLRRLSLHLTGRLPTPDEIRQYASDRAPDKQERLVERLLAGDEFVAYWTFRLGQLLRVRPQVSDVAATAAFQGWLRRQLEADLGWDQMASQLLTAEGDTHETGPANFYRVASDARSQAEYASELLMGVRLRCANCHNHPLDRWTQDDYHGLAAIFAKVERGRHVRLLARGKVVHPAHGGTAVARIPGERYLEATDDGRRALAEWLRQADNPYFARAMVNRIWKALMGRGLIEPTDDLRATNPPTHPALLDCLASDFVAHGFSLRHTIRTIVGSAAYSRSSVTSGEGVVDDRFYSRALTTPLEAEVLADAISDVTGIAAPYGDAPPGTRAIELSQPVDSISLDVLGRCDRTDSCESGGATGGLSTRLHLLNGPLLNARLAAPGGRLQRLQASGALDEQVIGEFYLAALGRHPRPAELKYWQEQFVAADKSQVQEDFVWALLSAGEFLTNH